MSIIMDRDGPGSTILINRPSVRNAVDRETASELANAFGRFEADQGARAAVLGGAAHIAAFPQTCLRGDRMSAYRQFALPFEKALTNEFNHTE